MTRAELLQIAKPILFNTEMVKAILEGRKTVTRRLVKFEGNRNPNWTGYIKDGLTLYNGTNEPCNKPCPYKVGDILYVRETWCWCPCWDCGMDTEEHNCCYESANKFFNHDKGEWGCYGYKASFEDNEYPSVDTWHPSIHMPKEAARIFLRVKDVRVERLQDITEEQAKAEGIREYSKDGKLWKYAVTDEWWIEYHRKHRKQFSGSWWQDMPRTAKEAFHHLWNSTLGRRDTPQWYANNWAANPWVWVIEFERIEADSEV